MAYISRLLAARPDRALADAGLDRNTLVLFTADHVLSRITFGGAIYISAVCVLPSADDGMRLDHIAEMIRLKGGEVSGDLGPRSESRLAILPDTTHVMLMFRMSTIVPMVNDFLDAKPSKQ